MAAHPLPFLTPEEYLRIERASPIKHEYYDGTMYAMPGVSYEHWLIVSNLVRKLGNALEGGSCTVGASDLRVRITVGGLHAYPDIVVVCGQPRFSDETTDMLLNPTLLIEVLSPSTQKYDRGLKSQEYRKIDSLKEYALASQDEPRVEVFRRQADSQRLPAEFAGLDSVCRLESVGAAIPLAQIYNKVEFPA
jgi:Uma2 family endonuclease